MNKNNWNRLNYLKNDLSKNIKGTFNLFDNELEIVYSTKDNNLDDVARLIFNRFKCYEIDVELIDMDCLIVRLRE